MAADAIDCDHMTGVRTPKNAGKQTDGPKGMNEMLTVKKHAVRINGAMASVALLLIMLFSLQAQIPAAHGVKGFGPGTYLFVVPPGVGSLEIEAWGGGGGGGSCTSGKGGGGGGGGYVHGTVNVIPNRGYDITVGAGGLGGDEDFIKNGAAGGASNIQLAGSTLLAAGGGEGGPGKVTDPNAPGFGGCGFAIVGGAGGGGNPNGGILIQGLAGGAPGVNNGKGGASVLGNRLPPGSAGGNGGGYDGDDGSPGYMIIKW